MRKATLFRRAALAVVSGVAVLGAGRAAAFDAQQFSPAVDPQGFFSVYSSQTAPRGRFHVALWYDFAGDPIRISTTTPGGLLSGPTTTTREVESVHTLDAVASFSLLDFLELGVDVPVSDLQKSEFVGTRDSVGVDDVRVLAKFQALPNRIHGFGFGGVGWVDTPSGQDRRLTAIDKFGGGGLAIGDFVWQRFRASLNGGYKVNQDADHQPVPGINEGSDEILFGLGLGVLAIKDQPILFGLVNNVEVLLEGFGATTPHDPFKHEINTPAEGLGGAKFYSPTGWYLTTGVGKTITDSINGPAVRVVASLGYSPPPPPPPPPPAPAPPPQPQTQVVETDEQIVTLAPVYFDFDKDTIKKVSYPVLDQVAEVMRRRATAVVRVEGHTDSFGSDSYNQRLSERRAHAVVRYLIAKGIDSSRLEAKGFGESRPIATNDTEAGRAKNRRTEFHIVRETREVGAATR
jgi:outer membrane protein OmpA-like peptidoglycan-associated protein